VVVCLAASATAGRAHGPQPPATPLTATPEELAAFEAAKPVFEAHCFRCHTSGGRKAKAKTLKHLDMGRYPFRGHHAGEAAAAVRRVLVRDKAKGKAPTMPSDEPGTVKGEELQKILTWAVAFEKARSRPTPGKPARAEPAHGHAH
jgi:hypothetical protein